MDNQMDNETVNTVNRTITYYEYGKDKGCFKSDSAEE